MGSNKAFTIDERRQIESLIKLSFSASQIGTKISRSKSGIVTEIAKNGGRKKYNAEQAQKRFEEAKENRFLKLTKNLTEEQERKAKEMITLGLSRHEISKTLEIPRQRLDKFLTKNGFHFHAVSRNLSEKVKKLENQLKLLTEFVRKNVQIQS